MYSGGYRSSDPSPTRRSKIDSSGSADVAHFGFTQDFRTVVLKRPSQQHGLGFNIRGGRELGLGIYISKVEPLSNAEKAGIKAGDQIISVNGKSFEFITHPEAIRILKSFSALHMVLLAVGRIPSTCILHQTYTWVDRNGRRVSPPDDSEPQFHRSSSTWSLYNMGKNSKLRKVTLSLEEGESLGLMIRGGTEYGLGIYITGVDPDSAADRANLQMGDQILEANDVSFEDITHDEAVRILKHSKHLVMKILDVGKIPFSCTMYDEMQWGIPGADDDVQSGLSADDESLTGYFVMTDPETLRMFEEKAKLVLTRKEESTLNYYRTEYDKGQVTLDAFVAVLLELLNTPDKFSLLSEIHELIPTCDREKFDDLIYSRELEIKKACQKLGSSLEHLVADQKADKARRSSADAYRYTALDKNMGKIVRHHNGGGDKDQSRHSFSSMSDSRRRISSAYDSPRRSLSASTQALYWGTDDPYGDDIRTPSEDSGVDLANGCHYGSRLPVERSPTAMSLVRSGHYTRSPGRRVTTGIVGPASPQQRRGRVAGWDDQHSPRRAPLYISELQDDQWQPHSPPRRPAMEHSQRPGRPLAAQARTYPSAATAGVGYGATSAATGPSPGSATTSQKNSAISALCSPQANRRHITRHPSGVQEPERARSSRATNPNYHSQDQIPPGDCHRGWSRHQAPTTSYHQHPPARSSSTGQWSEGRPRHSGSRWSESDGPIPSNRGQPHHQGVRRSLPNRNGADRRQNEETHSGDEAIVHHANQRRQTMIHEGDIQTAAALVSPRHHIQQPQQPLQQQSAAMQRRSRLN